jgi:tetratricopeptide (TPR) repeat protein
VDALAQAVARELERRGRGDTTQLQPAQPTSSIPAYELYLRGNDPALLRSDSAARRGLGYFEQAVALDSTYAAAWAGVARLRYRVSSGAPIAERPGLWAIAEAAARKAVTLDPNLGDGHGIIGMFRTMARDFPAAEAHLRRAVALEPTRAGFREWLSNFLLLTGRIQEAVGEAERAVALDPLSPSARAELARALIADGRCDQAMVHLTRVLAVDPPLLRAAPLVAQCHGRKGEWAEAISVVRPQAERGDPLAMAFAGYLYARSGQRAVADSIHARLEARVQRGEEGAYYLAFVPAALGDRDQAFKRLDQALEDGSLGFPSARSVPFIDPLFDDLRTDPRYERLRLRFLTPP